MKHIIKVFGTAALVLSLGLAGTTQVFAKGHDQGVADIGGGISPGDQIGTRGVFGGIGANQKDGVRGRIASGAGAFNSGANGSIGGRDANRAHK